METVTCNLCGSKEYTLVVQGRDRAHDGHQLFNMVRCNQCGLLYLNPRPDQTEILKYYPQEYMPYVTALEEEASIFRRLDRQYGLDKRRKLVTKLVDKPGKILDVGCATGVLLHEFDKDGWSCYGVELNPNAAMYAIEKFGLTVSVGTLESASYQSDYFDVITLWDVLEHIPDPKQTLAEIARIIRPGGYLVMSMPDPDALEGQIFGPAWAGYEIPRHFHLFPKNALNKYLEHADFELVRTVYFTGGHSVLVLSTKFLLANLTISERSKQWLEVLVRSLPVRLIAWPVYYLLSRLKLSSIVTVIARKL